MGQKYTVKNVKTFEGMEGCGFNASLYNGDKKVAFVMDEGRGGCYHFRWEDKSNPEVTIKTKDWKGNPHSYKGTPFEKEFIKYVDSLPQHKTTNGKIIDMDAEIFVGNLIDNFLVEKELKKKCKKKTLYVLKTDEDDNYWSINVPYCHSVVNHIKGKHGDNLKEIINERYL